jgi:hypothetical protein
MNIEGGKVVKSSRITPPESEEYSGKIVDVRNIIDNPYRKILSVEQTSKDGVLRCFTRWNWMTVTLRRSTMVRMVGTQVLPKTKRGVWKAIASALLLDGKPQTVS